MLVALFFSSQVFSCCVVNHRIGQFLLSALTNHADAPAIHSCCPPSQAARTGEAPHDSATKTGCCIQDSNQRLPQMVSEQAPVPDMTGLMVGLLPILPVDAPSTPKAPELQSRSSPPVYLAQLRLLI